MGGCDAFWADTMIPTHNPRQTRSQISIYSLLIGAYVGLSTSFPPRSLLYYYPIVSITEPSDRQRLAMNVRGVRLWGRIP